MEKKRQLIEAYLALADEKLIIARKLAALSHYDDAVSRAYYAMFHSAKAALLTVGSDPHSHSGVASEFSRHFVKAGQVNRQYSRMLTKAMQARQSSDYSPTIRAFQPDAEQTIADAEAFVAKIKEILGQL